MMAAPDEGPGATARRSRRVLAGALGAAVLVTTFMTAAARVAGAEPAASRIPSSGAATDPATGTDSSGSGLSVVVRTAKNLLAPGDADRVADRVAARGAQRAWVQVKQDEDEEVPSGTLFYPSALAPVAPGHQDGRLGELIGALADRGVDPVAWMPVLRDSQAATAHPEWRAQRITENGTLEPQPEWLCPFDPAVRAHQAAIAADAVTRFPRLAGLTLDFIRYDDDYSCATPAGLAELDRRTGWSTKADRALTPADIRRAGTRDAGPADRELWQAWHALRAEKITATVTEIRTAVQSVRPGLPVSAFLLPFNAGGYAQNTSSGQDLDRLAEAGLDEIVLMGYWDDWGHDPAWVRTQMDAAKALLRGRVPVSVVLDGDMGVRSTRLTLEALGPWTATAGWFLFDAWTDAEFARLTKAVEGHRKEGPMPKPEKVSVVIRIDTEPDDQPSYDTVRPEMIDTLLALFETEDIKATFITVGKLAELQPDAVRRAAAAGHEIGSHSYDHEQLDALPVPQQLTAVNGGLDALARLGFDVHGFGAPRNSITDETRDLLMARGMEYDGSAAYDPLTGLIDVRYEADSTGRDTRIVVVPFIIPNDYDARIVEQMTASEMAAAWIERLDKVVAGSEPVFVLDIHQWSASQPDNLAALRQFIRYAKECSSCQVETLRDAAAHARSVLDTYEIPSATSGVRS